LQDTRAAAGDNDMPFGAIRKGFAADIVATTKDLEKEFEEAVTADNVAFVMKSGRIYKSRGVPFCY
jgi:imidazolonepropionase-like amidohydrolase